MKKLTVKLKPNKTVEIYSVGIEEVNIKVRVRFVELNVKRWFYIYPRDYERWKEANPEKKLEDYIKEKLLPVYEALEIAVKLKEDIKAILE